MFGGVAFEETEGDNIHVKKMMWSTEAIMNSMAVRAVNEMWSMWELRIKMSTSVGSLLSFKLNPIKTSVIVCWKQFVTHQNFYTFVFKT